MDKSLKVQNQIRQNAEEVSGFLTDLQKWEKSIKTKDKQFQYIDYKARTGPRETVNTDPIGNPNHYINRDKESSLDNSNSNSKNSNSISSNSDNSSKAGDNTSDIDNKSIGTSAAKHTYDTGYKKWETFDVDAELLKEEEETTTAATSAAANKTVFTALSSSNNINNSISGSSNSNSISGSSSSSSSSNSEGSVKPLISSNPAASFFGSGPAHPDRSQQQVPVVPRARRALLSMEEAEAAERARGNDEYTKGNFAKAVKHYTTCLGMKKDNYVAFSNRAMVFIKQKEYSKAELDLNVALSIDDQHVKSLQRRGTARNAMGKYRAALADFEQALELDPVNKQVKMDVQRTKELLKSAIGHAPLVPVEVEFSA